MSESLTLRELMVQKPLLLRLVLKFSPFFISFTFLRACRNFPPIFCNRHKRNGSHLVFIAFVSCLLFPVCLSSSWQSMPKVQVSTTFYACRLKMVRHGTPMMGDIVLAICTMSPNCGVFLTSHLSFERNAEHVQLFVWTSRLIVGDKMQARAKNPFWCSRR